MKHYYHSIDMSKKEQEDILRIKKILESEMFKERETSLEGKIFTDGAVIVTVHGVRLIGESELRKFIQKSSGTLLANVQIKNEVIDVTFIRQDVAIVSAVQYIRLKQAGEQKAAGKGAMTFVMLKEESNWLIAGAQNTLVQDLPFDWKSDNN